MLIDTPNWNHVYYFYQIARHGSLKDAAAKLGFSAPTLSEHLNQLERFMGIELFARQHRKLSLTAQGLRLYQHARQMFEAEHQFLRTIAPLPLDESPVTIALVSSPSVYVAYEFIRDFFGMKQRFTTKVAQTSHRDLERGLRHGMYDFGLSDCPAESKELVSERVFSSVIRFFVDRKLARHPLSSLLREMPLLLCASESSNQRLIEHVLEACNLKPVSLLISEYPALLYDLCEKGEGVGLFNEVSVRQSRYRLKSIGAAAARVPLEDKLFAIYPRASEGSAAIQRMRQVMKNFGGDL